VLFYRDFERQKIFPPDSKLTDRCMNNDWAMVVKNYFDDLLDVHAPGFALQVTHLNPSHRLGPWRVYWKGARPVEMAV